MALVISFPQVANVLPIIDLPMVMENLPIAANGLPLVPIGNDMWEYFSESKWSSKSCSYKHTRSVRNCDCGKNEIVNHCWETDHNFSSCQKKPFDRERRLVLQKILKAS